MTDRAPAGPYGWTRPARTGIAVFLASGIAGAVINAGFQRLSASRIDPDDLGAFDALVAVVGGIGLFGLGLQVVVARARGRSTGVVRAGFVVGALGGLAAGLLTPGPAWYRLSIAGLLLALVVGVFWGVPARGRLLADASWRRLALVYLVDAATRVVVLLPLLHVIHNKVVATLAASTIAEVATSATAWVLAPQARLAPGSPTHVDAATARALLRGMAVLGGVWLLTVADTVVARLHLASADADAYAFASTAARSSFFLAVLLAHLALPTFMLERGRSEELRRAFVVTVFATAAGAAAVATVIVAAPRWTARQLLGTSAGVVDPTTLRLLTVAWALMAVVPLLTYFHLERHTRLAAVPLVGALVLVVGGRAAGSAHALAVVTLVSVGLCVLVIGVPAVQRLRPVVHSIDWRPATAPTVHARRAVTVVVPFFNPGPAVVVDTVGRLAAALSAAGLDHRIVAVSDGSTDGSAERLVAASIQHVEVVELDRNRGKGAALRAGFAQCGPGLVGYVDADGDLPPEQMVGLIDIAASTGADAVIGSKVHPDSELAVERHRQVMSSVFRVLVRLLFRLDVRDTQTGLKLFSGDIVASVGPLLREDGFAIDVEILVAALRQRPLTIVEAPVTIARGATTTVSVGRAIATVAALARIFWWDHVVVGYDAGVSSGGSVAPAAGA